MSEEQRESLQLDDKTADDEIIVKDEAVKDETVKDPKEQIWEDEKLDFDFPDLGKKNRDFLNILVSVLSIVTLCICTVTLIMAINVRNDVVAVRQDLDEMQAHVQSGGYAQISGEETVLDDVANVHGETVDGTEAADIVEAAELENVIWNADSDDHSGIRRVYLTFDDGPSSNTDRILDVLAKYDVKATFFVVGKDNYSEQYRRIVEEGHTLAMHSYSHVYSEIYKSVDAYSQDLTKLHDYLYELTGYDCNIVRFPGGSSNTVSDVDMLELAKYLDGQGMVYFDWNISSGDAEHGYLTPQQIADNVLGNLDRYNNAVVLMHDAANRDTTVDALPIIIEKILESEDTVLLPITSETAAVQHLRLK